MALGAASRRPDRPRCADSRWFRRNEEQAFAVVHLFLFVMTGVVYETQQLHEVRFPCPDCGLQRHDAVPKPIDAKRAQKAE